MKSKPILWMALCAAELLAIPFPGWSQNQIPAAINYQGRLTDVLGNPVGSGYYEVEFRIWDDAVQNGAGNLVWGRSFPIHVVADGLFNVLLTDDGGQITTPTTPTSSLLDAFSGPDRYLGLTITVSNNVPMSQSEISPRQQLASAPFAIQAQQANTVVPLGVVSDALAPYSVVEGKIATNAVTEYTIENGAVTEDKIGTGAVTKDKIGSGAVTEDKIGTGAVTKDKIGSGAVTEDKIGSGAVATANIQNGAVTSAKLNVDGDIHLNNQTLYLRGASDQHHGLKYTDSFGGTSMDGPALFGYSNGVLGTTTGGEKAALSWGSDQSVTASGTLSVKGTLSVEGGSTSFGSVKVLNFQTAYTAPSDGFVTYHAYKGAAVFTLWDANGTVIVSDNYFYNTANADTAWFTMPVAKGEHFRWSWPGGGPGSNAKYLWRSIGKNVGNPPVYNP